MFPAPKPEIPGEAPPSPAEQAMAEYKERASRALRVAERFCTFRARCKPLEMANMFDEQGVMVTINNVVAGKPSIYASVEDGQRFTHLAKWFKPWVVCQNTLEDPTTAPSVTVEREGKIFTGVWFFDPSYIAVRETCVVNDDQITLFSTQRKF